jgi:hypothetical protein
VPSKSNRLTIGPFTGGVDLQSDPCIMDARRSPLAADLSMARGICETRAGYRVLDKEPSYIAGSTPKSVRQTLSFDAASSESGTATFTRPLNKGAFSIIYEGLPSNTSDGTYVLATVYDGSNLVAQLEYVVSSATVAWRLKVRDSTANTLTGTTPFASTATWGAQRRYIVATYAAGSIVIYVGGIEQTTTNSGSSTGIFNTPTTFYFSFDGTTNYASQAVSQFVLINRSILRDSGTIDNFSQSDPMRNAYFPLGYPVDSIENDPDILLHYAFNENTGTTVYDWSQFGADMTLANTPTWIAAGGQTLQGRGLGMGVWRDKSGTRFNVLGFSRSAPRGTDSVNQGVVYVDRCDRTWALGGATADRPIYYIGGTSTADETSPSLSGLDSFARMQFLQAGHRFMMLNGVDYIRQITVSTWKYLGGTAPPTAPILTASGTGSNWKICYTYYNPVDDVETGRSPVLSVTNQGIGMSVTPFLSSDSQFTHIRWYRTVSDGTKFYLEATTTPGAYVLAISDANLVAGPVLAGDGSAEGNRKVKRLYLAFPDFRPETPTEGAQKGPISGPTLGVTGAGGSLSAGNYYVAYAYRNSTTGDETGMSPAVLQAVSALDRIDVSAMVLPGDTNYNQIVLYRTKVNAFTWYEDKVITAAATSTLTQADSTLTTTIEKKALPPVAAWGAVFANRLWLLQNDGTLCYSTAGDFGAFPYDNAYRGRGKIGGASILASRDILIVGYEDGVAYALPNPGSETNLTFFMIVNFQLYSEYGACIAQDTIRETVQGMLWLGLDGVYRYDGQSVVRVSDPVTPFFRYMNLGRARYATAVYKDDENLYMVAVPRGLDKTSRLNDSWMTHFNGQAWMPYQLPPCDVAGVLEDANGNNHYCFIMPTGILLELLTKSVTQQVFPDVSVCFDGVEVATAANLATVTACSMGALTYTAPAGFDGGFALWLLRNEAVTSITNHTMQRWVVANGTPFLDGFNFYPMAQTVVGNTYKGYLGGIRSYWTTSRFICIPEESDRLAMIEDSYIHQRWDVHTQTTSIQAVLAGETPTQITIAKLPSAIVAPSTYLGIQHPETLISVADGNSVRLQVQHGGWPAAGLGQSASAASRSHQFLFVNNPPEPRTGFKVESVAFTFTPQASA